MERRIIGVGAAPHGREREAAVLPGGGPADGEGVRHWNVDAESEGQRLDNLLVRLLKGVPKSHLYRVIRSGEVRLNGRRVLAQTRVACGDRLRLPPMRTAQRAVVEMVAPARAFPLLFEDEHLLAVDKPAGVAVHGGSGVSFGVIEQLRRARPQARYLELVHRLDSETSGVLLVACRRSALTRLQDQFRQRGTDKVVGKTYTALVAGDWPDRLKVIDTPLRKDVGADGERRVHVTAGTDPQALAALTLLRVLRRWPGFSLLDVTIRTGRTHQIRVHLASQGNPILGDDRYGDFELNRRIARAPAGPGRLSRMALHARHLRFAHPADGRTIELASPLPDDLAAFLRGLDNAAVATTAASPP